MYNPKWFKIKYFLHFTEKSPDVSSSSRRFTRTSAPSPADGPNARKRKIGTAPMKKLQSGGRKRIKDDDNTSTNDSDKDDSSASTDVDPHSDTDPDALDADAVAQKSPPRKKYVIHLVFFISNGL